MRGSIFSCAVLCAVTSISVMAEEVYVKYRGAIDLSSFRCVSVSRSSLVNRICYDAAEQYTIVSLNGTYYHYCEMPRAVVSAWREADSMGRFYNQHVKGRYDCRVLRMPAYDK